MNPLEGKNYQLMFESNTNSLVENKNQNMLREINSDAAGTIPKPVSGTGQGIGDLIYIQKTSSQVLDAKFGPPAE